MLKSLLAYNTVALNLVPAQKTFPADLVTFTEEILNRRSEALRQRK